MLLNIYATVHVPNPETTGNFWNVKQLLNTEMTMSLGALVSSMPTRACKNAMNWERYADRGTMPEPMSADTQTTVYSMD